MADWKTTNARLGALAPTREELQWLIGYLASAAGDATYARAIELLADRRTQPPIVRGCPELDYTPEENA